MSDRDALESLRRKAEALGLPFKNVAAGQAAFWNPMPMLADLIAKHGDTDINFGLMKSSLEGEEQKRALSEEEKRKEEQS